MQTLETERLILRKWKMSDAEEMFSYASGDIVGPMAGWKPHESIHETRKIIEMFLADDDTWAVEHKESGRVIGSVGLHRSGKCMDKEKERELGYVLAEPFWGQGLIPEACKAAIGFAFRDMHIDTLFVSHFIGNTQSKRVIEKLGFTYLYRLVDSWKRYDGTVLSEDVYFMRAKG